ncbi:MAG TPA: hypothetical protein VLV86_21650 [Vicinamibacterales bacterium]|nr:hypothetical protein [Vicinamibacterales bacterium]
MKLFQAVALVLVLASTALAETVDRVLAVVAGELIMLSDVNAVRELGIVHASPDSRDPTADVLARLIDRELMLAEVDRYAPPEPDPKEVDREVAAIRDRFPTAKAFEDALQRSGFDLTHLREIVRQNLRLKAYLDQRFAVADADQQRRQKLVDDWLAGLRRRSQVVNLYEK